MADEDRVTPTLPGNHGQFGEGDATEEYETLPAEKQPAPPPVDVPVDTQVDGGPKQTGAGERS